MNFKTIITASIITFSTLITTAQTHTSAAARAAHNKAHREQLANNKNRMDRDVINNMVKHDIDRKNQ
ncbi:MAG TPA: hypothetical protein DC009_04725, partial [Porphyromonadaceae bacterium]|nr:hypothetical protein [Porphyromonadaceae bacterium]